MVELSVLEILLSIGVAIVIIVLAIIFHNGG